MKKKLLFLSVSIFLIIVSCNNKDIYIRNSQKYIQSEIIPNLNNPKSYDLIEIKIDTIFSEKDIINNRLDFLYNRQGEISELAANYQRKYQECALNPLCGRDSVNYYTEQFDRLYNFFLTVPDSILHYENKLNNLIKNNITIIVKHRFRATNSFNALIIVEQSLYLNENGDVVKIK